MTITRIKGKTGTRYKAQIFVNGQRPSATFNTLSEAAKWEEETRALLKGGGVLVAGHDGNTMSFRDAADRFIVEVRSSRSTGQVQNYEFAAKQLLKSFGASTRLDGITPQDVAAHVLRRMNSDGVGASIIRLELSFIRLVYARANDWGISLPSPELTIKRPRPKMKGREEALDRVIKPDELAAILNESKNRASNLYQYLVLLLYTGMRPSEAAGLYWQRLPVKEEKEALKAKRPVGFVDLARGGFSKIGTKTGTRFVPAHPVVVDMLGKITREDDQRLVFLPTKYEGRDRAYLYYRRPLDTTLKNARLPDGSSIRGDINFYSFRHTARSAMSTCGIATEVAETIIGHQDSSFKFTYIHLSDEDLVGEIGKLRYPGINQV